jgi:hypothetical protein
MPNAMDIIRDSLAKAALGATLGNTETNMLASAQMFVCSRQKRRIDTWKSTVSEYT